uniref:uncharacterized protein LOC124073549 isoform X2 n=1 Tax=Scatophagus argus TaxID=75038 RepID=UPI001ED8523C|nr:uncharacterized protein LOC124073549 isoform X2 [Scatophagus argus]
MTAKFPGKQLHFSQPAVQDKKPLTEVRMEGHQGSAHHSWHCQNKVRTSRLRLLHESTLNLGDTAPCYTTTHHQSYSGRSADGRPLIFHLRDPSVPSQHQTGLDLSDITAPPLCPLQSHTKELHGPKHVAKRTDPKEENWARYRSGRAIRELTSPQDASGYQSIYKAEHTLPVPAGSPQLAGGRPTQWHQHNILTGELRQAAGPRTRSGDEPLRAARRWETDCCALRLY